jgi:hypothetical protein
MTNSGAGEKPSYHLPALACEAHCSIFGPAMRFYYAPDHRYTSEDAPKELLFAPVGIQPEIDDRLNADIMRRTGVVNHTCSERL